MFYSIGQGIKNIWRNKMFSLASIATMAANIFLFGLIFILVLNVRSMVHEAESGVTITVFFDEGTSDERIQEIGQEILARDEVTDIVYVSAEEALQQYIDEYMNGSEEASKGLESANPLANSANYEVYMQDISQQGELASYIESLDGVRQVNQSVIAANILSDFNKLIGYVSIAVMVILLGVAVFLISNTIRVGIAVRSEEIGIMKLIGASNLFIRAPFLIEGMIIGLIGSVIPLVIIYFLYQKIITYVLSNFVFLSDIINFIPVHTAYVYLAPIALLLGAGIGLLGSLITIRKHLNV
jgi:cell division transport system permease protein